MDGLGNRPGGVPVKLGYDTYMKFLRAIALLCAVAGLSLSQTPAPKKATTGPAATKKAAPAAATKTDAAIEQDLKDRLAKSKLAADKFGVSVKGGVATLSGKTEVVQHKGTATRMAKSAGATSVVNNIEVSDAGKAKAAATLKKSKK